MATEKLESLTPGTILAGKYEVVSKLGRGAMGVVYRVRDTVLQRDLVLKFLLSPPHSTPEEGDRLRRRFIREAQSAARLNHPNIVTIYEASQVGDLYYIAMEVVEGGSLEDLVTKVGRPTELADICGWILQSSLGLAEAHREGIIHRDVKPSNLLLSRSGQIKIADFGIAKVEAEPSGLTQEGTVIGTASYMSPEQLQVQPLDGRSDQFSLGCAWYWLLTGVVPFDAANPASLLYKILFEAAAPIRDYNPGVPDELDRMVRRCLAKDPADRYSNLYELADAITAFLAAQNMVPSAIRPGSGPIPIFRPPAVAASTQSLDAPTPLQRLPVGTASTPMERVPAGTASAPMERVPAGTASAPMERVPAGTASTQKLPQSSQTASGPIPRPVPPPPARASAPPPSASRRWLRVAAGLLLLAVGVGGGWFALRIYPRWQADRLWALQNYDGAFPIYASLYAESSAWEPGLLDRLREYAAFKQRSVSAPRASTLRLLNWNDRLGKLTLFLFSERTNIGVDLGTYDRVETIPENLGAFDLVIVPQVALQELIASRKLVPMDHHSIPNLKNLDPYFQNLGHDRGNEFAVPYVFGTAGILYNTARYPVPPQSWGALFDTAQTKGRSIAVPESPRILVGLALKFTGASYGSTDPAQIEQAVRVAREAASGWQRLPRTEFAAKTWLLREDFDLALVSMTQGLAIARERPEMRFLIPREGSSLAVDSFAIPRGSRNVAAAFQFIDHVLDERIGAEIADHLLRGTPNAAARRHLSPQDLLNEGIVPSLGILNQCDPDLPSSEILAAVEKAGGIFP